MGRRFIVASSAASANTRRLVAQNIIQSVVECPSSAIRESLRAGGATRGIVQCDVEGHPVRFGTM